MEQRCCEIFKTVTLCTGKFTESRSRLLSAVRSANCIFRCSKRSLHKFVEPKFDTGRQASHGIPSLSYFFFFFLLLFIFSFLFYLFISLFSTRAEPRIYVPFEEGISSTVSRFTSIHPSLWSARFVENCKAASPPITFAKLPKDRAISFLSSISEKRLVSRFLSISDAPFSFSFICNCREE